MKSWETVRSRPQLQTKKKKVGVRSGARARARACVCVFACVCCDELGNWSFSPPNGDEKEGVCARWRARKCVRVCVCMCVVKSWETARCRPQLTTKEETSPAPSPLVREVSDIQSVGESVRIRGRGMKVMFLT